MSDVPANGTAYRLAELERRVGRVENLEPAVMKQEIRDVKEDIAQLADGIGSVRKILIGFLVTFAFGSVTIVIAIFSATGGFGR